ncbi:MAG TPA: polynucleotide adenylyltransferase PcnB [Gammaproteobacteria bacterium]|nr:polynucleotide adenylyltransferase PcnB [Gammaproteobacteria bacterium]
MLSWLKRFWDVRTRDPQPESAPVIVPRSEHPVSRKNISSNAVKVMYRLKDAGFEAHLVGGGVRDLLLGREPKDFDVATNATPEDVKALFRNCRLIGRRFRLAHVYFRGETIEVATFRGHHGDGGDGEGEVRNGMVVRDNVYGTMEEDAVRRDFTVNALYYNIADHTIVDYVGGLGDLHSGLLRLIGDPRQRYREDPVRMLRAVRFAAKLGFRIEKETEAAMLELGQLLTGVPPARLFDEMLKMFLGGQAVATFELMRHYGQFGILFPQTEASLEREEQGFPITFLLRAMENTDLRVAQGKPVTPAFLFAAILWEPVRQLAEQLRKDGVSRLQSLQDAGDRVLEEQRAIISVPRRFTLQMREIWSLQERLRVRSGKRASRVLNHPRFRAGYDFMLLRAESGEEQRELADWWTRFQEVDQQQREQMIASLAPAQRRSSRRRRRSRRRPPVVQPNPAP